MCAASNATDEHAGLRMMKIQTPNYDSRAGTSICYPNGSGGDRTVVAGNAAFHGVEATI